MTRTFESPSSYHPSYSLLGRAIRTWVGDRLRGEALYIVVLTGLTLGLLMAHYLGWALLKPVLTAHPSWQTLFWGGQIASVLVLVGVGLLGVRPAVRVRCMPDEVVLSQDDRSLTIPYDAIEEADQISARRYHRHYRRYARTRVFVSTLPETLLLLRTEEGPVIVGLSNPDEQSVLFERLQAALSTSPEAVAQVQS